MQSLVCPLCRGEVAVGASGCLSCRLPMGDVVRHQRSPKKARSMARAASVRVTGLVLYGATVAWCAYALQGSLPFVIPGAVLGGGVLHVWKGRAWLGLAVFALIVVVVPLLLLPALGVGTFADMTSGL